jgi:2-polyprenyl-3-methyl-5-hydroxy-6-metoxy-1,4-benzoquinol methylase
MTLFPLDTVRNASIDQDLELLLEDVREDVAAFPFTAEIGGQESVLEAYDQARPRLNVLAALLTGMPGASGVDISTGLGFLAVLLARRGHQMIATEREPSISAFAAGHDITVLPYRIGVDRVPVAAGSLDFVVFAEVLEHLKTAPVTTLREVASLLKPGGRFLLTTPNVARLEHVELLAAGENFLEPFPDELPGGVDATDHLEHVREYSVREVVDAIESAGLGIERVVMTGWGEGGYRPLANPFANGIIVVEASR